MASTTEVALLKVHVGLTIDDPSTDAGKIWLDTLNTVASQAGYQRSYWSLQIEDPTVLMWLIDWDSLECHKDFINSNAYKPFFEHAAPIFDLSKGPPLLYHVNFLNHPPDVPKIGPVTELVTFFYPLDIDESSLENHAKKCMEVFSKASAGPHTINGGWVAEGELDNPTQPGTKAKPFTFLLAWDDIAQHEQFRTTKEFLEGIDPVRKEVIGRWMGHAKFQPVE